MPKLLNPDGWQSQRPGGDQLRLTSVIAGTRLADPIEERLFRPTLPAGQEIPVEDVAVAG